MDFAALLRQERDRSRKKGAGAAAVTSQDASEDCREEEVLFEPFTRLIAAKPEPNWESTRRVKCDLDSVFYFQDWINDQDHDAFMEQVYCKAAKWKELPFRRLQCYQGNGLPPWIQNLADTLVRCGIFPVEIRPDHALLNEYLPGQGILGHTDGCAYLPLVACLSLGSPALISFRERLATHEIGTREPKLLCQLLLQPKSLIVFKADAYEYALHEICPTFSETLTENVANLDECCGKKGAIIERGTRISVTMRRSSEQEKK
uniref:Fe2OG dioxygenase domain-containing protein n=1 Tax=Mucochytrium quahogii TaxID=96639 RepID=A0A7S2RZS8_9STRA|mmetsp:Transcript_15292/g.24871  ORF Transcript_15292/g.24871 Transcript_15292/m.24871 type:complete len:261 (-) Transcript_15292:1549-2331(-)